MHSGNDDGQDRKIRSLEEWDQRIGNAGFRANDEDMLKGDEQAQDTESVSYADLSRAAPDDPVARGEEGAGYEADEPISGTNLDHQGSAEEPHAEEDPRAEAQTQEAVQAQGVGEDPQFHAEEEAPAPDLSLSEGSPDGPEVSQEAWTGSIEDDYRTPGTEETPPEDEGDDAEQAFVDASRDYLQGDEEEDKDDSFYDGGLDPEAEIDALFREEGLGVEGRMEDYSGTEAQLTAYDEYGFPMTSDMVPWSPSTYADPHEGTGPGDDDERPLDFDDRDRRGPNRR